MKKMLLTISLFVVVNAGGQVGVGTIKVGDDTFTIKHTFEIEEYADQPIKKIGIYKKSKKILTHTISEVWGDDNSESIELGAYEISDSTLTFYSYWARAGDAPISPFGVRKQVYRVAVTGKLVLAESKMYIETTRQGWEENTGIEYIFISPKNATQRRLLVVYIREVEKKYNAHFVFGKQSDALFKEVRAKLSKEIYTETKDWSKIEQYKTFGYKK